MHPLARIHSLSSAVEHVHDGSSPQCGAEAYYRDREPHCRDPLVECHVRIAQVMPKMMVMISAPIARPTQNAGIVLSSCCSGPVLASTFFLPKPICRYRQDVTLITRRVGSASYLTSNEGGIREVMIALSDLGALRDVLVALVAVCAVALICVGIT